jgi:predicted O-linked N-acetylglucosamine transferase (SPINDLY family)
MMQVLDREELVADTQDDYVELTAALAEDPPRLQHLRRTIRPTMQQTVCNARNFATDIETAFAGFLQSPVSAGNDSNPSLLKEPA